MFIVPVQEDTAFWRQRTSFEGTDYLLDFNWNARAGAWFLSLLDINEQPLVLGMKLVCNVRLLRRKRYRGNLPPGEIMALDTTRKISAPDYSQLGTIVPLVYYDSAELAALGLTD